MTGIHQALAGAGSINLQLESFSSGSDASAGTNHVVTLPANLTGRMVYLITAHRAGAVACTRPTGWSLVFQNNTYPDSLEWSFWYKLCDGSEGATATFTSASSIRAAWLVYSFVNQIATTSNAVTDFLSPPAANTTPDPPSYNDAQTYSGSVAAMMASATTTTVLSYPTNWDQGQQSVTGGTGASGFVLAGAYRFNEAVNQDPGTFSISASVQTGAATIIIK